MPEWIECYVLVNIDPKCCGPLARDLNAVLPLRIPTQPSRGSASADTTPPPPLGASDKPPDSVSSSFPKTDHLKRIRRRPATADEISSREASEIEKPETNIIQESSSSTNNNDRASVLGSTAINGNDKKGNDCCKSAINNNEEVAINNNNKHPLNPKRTKKKSKKSEKNSAPISLDILVGSIAAIDHHSNIEAGTEGSNNSTSSTPSVLDSILKRYNLPTTTQSSSSSKNFMTRRSLPGRPAHTKEELDEWNTSIWPTLFFEEKTLQYKEEQMALSSEEVKLMKMGMKEALGDAIIGQQQWREWKQRTTTTTKNTEDQQEIIPPVSGIVVINPLNGNIVSKASDEREMQGMPENNDREHESMPNNDSKNTPSTQHDHIQQWSAFPDDANPLCTSVLLAIQGVSRRERQIALGCGMESKQFQRGQVSDAFDVMAKIDGPP